ncbi:hypothetical protein Cni_G11439 [Canna indica]|uniref:Aquaporin n=1 Tax=Canna indica TaxID=4628 RepID=A0AAQ3K834_9LILI|nr:hypothetical protein Cni_G11439 [Canna indica]
MVYSLGYIFGAHFNPAITFAFITCRRFPWKQVCVFSALLHDILLHMLVFDFSYDSLCLSSASGSNPSKRHVASDVWREACMSISRGQYQLARMCNLLFLSS